MKVASYDGEGRCVLEERPVPVTEPGELLLRLEVCGLCGTDLFKIAHRTVPKGTVLGHELVGTVAAVGTDALDESGRQFQVGERVVVPHHVPCGECAYCRGGSETMCETFRENLLEPGGFAEFVRVQPRAVRCAARRVPAAVSSDAAVFLEPAACVLRGVRRAGLRRDGAAVVIGGGSMGLLHVLVLRAAFPDLRIVLSDPVVERQALARELGANVGIGPDDLLRSARAESHGIGADAVFDTVGGARVLRDALESTRAGGTVVLFAHAPEGQAADFDLNRLFHDERRVVATYSGALSEQREVFEWIASGRLDASRLVTRRLPFSRFQDAVDGVAARRDLKVLLVPDP